MELLRTNLAQKVYYNAPSLTILKHEEKNILTSNIDFNEVLDVVEQIIKPKYLNNIQILVLQYVCQGLTYTEIAQIVDYDFGYVKDTGSKLWKMLSESLGRKVNKQNVQIILENYVRQLKTNSLINWSYRNSN